MSATHILGISAFYHDSAACLLRDGEIVAAAQEERFTRKKGDAGLPATRGGVLPRSRPASPSADLAFVGFYDKPLLKFERILETYLGAAPRGLRLVPHGRPALDQGEALHRSPAPRGPRATRASHPLRRAPRVPRRERLLPLALRGSRDPHDGRRRANGRRPRSGSAAATTSSSSRSSTGPTRSACSTPPSPTTPGSRSTPASTRSWGSPPTASRSTWT